MKFCPSCGHRLPESKPSKVERRGFIGLNRFREAESWLTQAVDHGAEVLSIAEYGQEGGQIVVWTREP